MLAVHDSEPVADEELCQRGKLIGERTPDSCVLGRLAHVEPQVLEQHNLPVRQATNRQPG